MRKQKVNVIVLTIFLLTGCATVGTKPAGIPSSKRFSKIRVKMSQSQMTDLIGGWSDFEVKTNYAYFIPIAGFFIEPVYTVAYYKGNGRVYLEKYRIYKIEYDPSEDGYK